MARRVPPRKTPEADDIPVVHVCLLSDKSTAMTEIPAILSGDPFTPACSIGSNTQRSAESIRQPLAVVFGGAVSAEEADAIKDAARESGVDFNNVKWLAVKGNKAAGPPSSDKIAAKIRELLVEAGL